MDRSGNRPRSSPDTRTDVGNPTRSILDSAHEAFISMDAGGFITDWNHQAEVHLRMVP